VKTICIMLFFVVATMPARAADHEFHGLVSAIETNYGVHHMHIPLLGVALFFVRPAGFGAIKVAVFERFPNGTDPADISRVVESSLGPGWHPFVRVRSKSDRETTLIYANPSSDKMRMMVVCVEPSEATLVELKLSERNIKRLLKDPGEESVDHHGRSKEPADI